MAPPDNNNNNLVEDTRTIVTNSPVPSEIDNNSNNDNTETAIATTGTTANSMVDCPLRASGRVCVCAPCEAARDRLLDRKQQASVRSSSSSRSSSFSNSNNNKRKKDGNDDDKDAAADNDDDKVGRQVDSKRRAIAQNATDEASSINSTMSEEDRIAKMSLACRTILECIGEDPQREGLVKTPERWAKALLFMCRGYHQTPAQVTNDAVFLENHNEMVVVRNIDIHSLCEHHMVPFTGHVHIGYIPNGKIIGLSKLARMAELFARRLQVQERLTRQIADAVVETVQPLGVAVVVECTHFCMVMRGVQKAGALTTTSSVRGCFETNPKTRAEFFSILQNGK